MINSLIVRVIKLRTAQLIKVLRAKTNACMAEVKQQLKFFLHSCHKFEASIARCVLVMLAGIDNSDFCLRGAVLEVSTSRRSAHL
jgi:hypothetical protein